MVDLRAIFDDYVLTLAMIVLVMAMAVVGGIYGINSDQLPVSELLGGLLVLAGRLIKPQ